MRNTLCIAGLLLITAAPLGHASYEFDGQNHEDEGSRKILRLRDRRLSGMRILWWNVEYGKTNRGIAAREGGRRPLDQNLLTLIAERNPPDVIALGEYSESALLASTRAELAARYPFSIYRPYGAGLSYPCGIKVFSRYPFDLPHDRILGWTPSGADQSFFRQWWTTHDHRADVSGFERPLLQLRIQRRFAAHRGLFGMSNPDTHFKPVHIVPFHAMNPWLITQRIFSSDFFREVAPSLLERAGIEVSWNHWIFGEMFGHELSELLGQSLTGQLVLFGTRHPLAQQLRELHRILFFENTRIDPSFFDQNRFLLIGDFNLPVLAIPGSDVELVPRSLQWFESYLTRLRQSAAATYPTPSGVIQRVLEGETPGRPFQIDHVFVSMPQAVAFSEVIPLRGSDHFPVYSVIEDTLRTD